MFRQPLLSVLVLMGLLNTGVLMAQDLQIDSLGVKQDSNRFQISYQLKNVGADWIFVTNISNPTFLLEERSLVVQMVVHSPPTRMYLGDEFGAKGLTIAPGGQRFVVFDLVVDRFENTPYLPLESVKLLHQGQDLEAAVSSIAQIILRIGYVTCDSSISVSETRVWKSGDGICGAPLEHLQAVRVERISIPAAKDNSTDSTEKRKLK